MLILALSFLSFSGVETADAQRFGRVEDTESNVAYFYHASPGVATVQVSMWGTIPRPGVYEVPDTTSLDKLLTMAGGMPLEPRRKRQDPPRIMVRLYRPQQEGKTLMFESSLEEMLRRAEPYPALRDDDIVVVKTIRSGSPFGWRDALTVASTAGTVALVALRIFRFSN